MENYMNTEDAPQYVNAKVQLHPRCDKCFTSKWNQCAFESYMCFQWGTTFP